MRDPVLRRGRSRSVGPRQAPVQRRLLSDAVDDYGSLEEASRWVAPPENSLDVAGAAVDLGPVDGAAWLDQNGAAFGLCRTYANEGWHFEYFGVAPPTGCPAMYTDAAHDPRLL
nr:hypothetical protein [Corynebacterium variabile]